MGGKGTPGPPGSATVFINDMSKQTHAFTRLLTIHTDKTTITTHIHIYHNKTLHIQVLDILLHNTDNKNKV